VTAALRLERFGRDNDATWGRLYLAGTSEVFFTVEPPWSYNRAFESCIPHGTYDLVRHDSAERPGSWAMVGYGVSHIETPNVPRFACLIHSANWAYQLKGCAAPGDSIRWTSGRQGVTNSRVTLQRIDEHLSALVSPRIEIVSSWG